MIDRQITSFFFRVVFTSYYRNKGLVTKGKGNNMIEKLICWNIETVNIWREIIKSDKTVDHYQVVKDNDRDRFEIEVAFKS